MAKSLKKLFEAESLNLRKTTLEKINSLKRERDKWQKYLQKLNEVKDLDELRRQTEIHFFCLTEDYGELFKNNLEEENYH